MTEKVNERTRRNDDGGAGTDKDDVARRKPQYRQRQQGCERQHRQLTHIQLGGRVHIPAKYLELSRRGYLVQSGSLPDANAVLRLEVQFSVCFWLERIVQFVKIANDPRALFRRAVRVGDQALTQIGFTIIAAPYLRPTKEKALIAGHSVNHQPSCAPCLDGSCIT